jgi:hypothetical protein
VLRVEDRELVPPVELTGRHEGDHEVVERPAQVLAGVPEEEPEAERVGADWWKITEYESSSTF